MFDPGYCRTCAQHADLLDHYHRVQREEGPPAGDPTVGQAGPPQRDLGPWASRIGLLLAAIALLTG